MDKITELSNIYLTALDNLQNSLFEKSISGRSTNYTRELIASVDDELRVLNTFTKKWAKGAVPKYYGAGIDEAYAVFRSKNIDISKAAVNNKILTNLVANVTNDLTVTNAYIGRQIKDEIRTISLDVMKEKFSEGKTIKEIKKRLLDSLTENGIIEVRDKNGRKLNVKAYAEMVARTTSTEAQNVGALQQMKTAGHDLVKIPSNATSCGLCAILQGRVYSISGKDTRYPPLSRAFHGGYNTIHPNCKHRVVPYIERMDKDAEATRRTSNKPFELSDADEKKVAAYEKAMADKAAKKKAKAAPKKTPPKKTPPKTTVKTPKKTPPKDAIKPPNNNRNNNVPYKMVGDKQREEAESYWIKNFAADRSIKYDPRVDGLNWKNASWDDYKTRVTENLKKLTDPSKTTPQVRVPVSASNKIVKDGRWKSQFEVNDSMGSLDPGLRARVENKLFDAPIDLTPELRPIYGYLSDEAIDTGHDYAMGYGEVIFKLKRENILDRTTVVFDDSLGTANAPCPLNDVDFLAAGYYDDPLKWKSLDDVDIYTEIQIHGGLTMDDVESVVIETYRLNMADDRVKEYLRDLADALDELGIDWDTKKDRPTW